VRPYIIPKPNVRKQYAISVGVVATISIFGALFYDFLGYEVIAFLLLLGLSILAISFDILPVLISATLSALILGYFFIPPRFTLNVHTNEDRILLVMYFLVAMINAALTNQIRSAEKNAKEKDERAKSASFYNALLSSLSHELRTPITTILGSTDNLQSNSTKLTEADKAELINDISVASVRLNQQVENLLNMSRLESGVFQVKKDWCDINELVYKTLQRLDANLQKFKVSVEIPDQLPLFMLDFGLMEQVLYNLILNATQHTPEGTLITIKGHYVRDRLVLEITDNGKGFPEDEIEKVFNKFYRVKGSPTGGTGLGLSIVRGFVEAQNGTIRLQNLPVKGSKFTIEILTDKAHINKIKDAE
jgi:two-component system sensor histidine kinase KdpD